MTPEEKKFQESENNAAGALVTLRWLQTDTGSRFIQNTHNAGLIEKWLKRHGKEWNLENLEEAFLACESQMLAQNPAPAATPTPEPPTPQPPTEASLYGVWKDLTKPAVRAMDGKQMREAMRDPRFVAKVNSLSLTREDLYGNGSRK